MRNAPRKGEWLTRLWLYMQARTRSSLPTSHSDPSTDCIALSDSPHQPTGASGNDWVYCICFSPCLQVLATMETPTALSSRLSAKLPAWRLVQGENGGVATYSVDHTDSYYSVSSPGNEITEEWPELHPGSQPSHRYVGGGTPSPSLPSPPPHTPHTPLPPSPAGQPPDQCRLRLQLNPDRDGGVRCQHHERSWWLRSCRSSKRYCDTGGGQSSLCGLLHPPLCSGIPNPISVALRLLQKSSEGCLPLGRVSPM